MARRAVGSRSLHWLTLAVVLPLLVLAVLAAVGARSQMQAAWADARMEAERLAPAIAAELEHDLGQSINEIAIYPDPPIPGEPSPKDEILNGTDIGALENLRNDPDAGISPAGLPRRVLAGLAIHRLDRGWPANVAVMEGLLTVEAPSVLTTLALEKMQLGGMTEARWRREEEIRARVKELGLDEGDVWELRDGVFVHIIHREGKLSFVQIPDMRVDHDRSLPPWAQARLALASSPPGPEVIATSRVRVGSGLEVRILADTSLIEAPVRRLQKWMFAMLGASLATAAVALAVLHRTIRRERQLGEMKSQFVASVSHELRAPVASIRLMADALEAGKVAPETAREFHRLIAREGARLSTLVGNVLDHARIEQGRKVWHMEPCDLAALAADTLRVMEPLARERGITLRHELAPVEASVDADAIQQALVNLLDNAIKFSPPDTAIVTTLANYGKHRTFRLSVRDEGPGIPAHEHARIFERFYRPGDELRRETQGTGIGLSLVKSIAEAHHGTVTVESAPGAGSTFILELPVALSNSSTGH
ncbi:HAMP domain-containing histidine kinase [Luteolibacter flavescens]|uniref:histidine kinase n=1 Tax=Luteolibacter flavescens TaxID=1859460 RepID=A0ABT3FRA8_9BACT|nr:HAMP domain-containing sensor histidine kinase [Luteolibacter flavescens]MCW1886123.1 HAMP domain-containing histidine kinase [Luteolibacter flavescens]